MGYDTWFNGCFEIDKKLDTEHHAVLNEFFDKRHCDEEDTNKLKDKCPSLYCDWGISDCGTKILWNGNTRFYNYEKWIHYIIDEFMNPWGYILNGEMSWEGEENTDMGKLILKNNKLTIKKAKITYEEV